MTCRPVTGEGGLSLVFGTALPTGAVGIAGHGAQPYLQMPLVVGIERWLGLERQADRVLSPDAFGSITTARTISSVSDIHSGWMDC
jgi:hypothetical protein